MKQIIFIFTIMITSFFCYAQLETHGYLEAGYNLQAGHEINSIQFNYDNTFFIDFQIYFLFYGFKLGGNIKTDFAYIKIDEYSPFLNHYTIFLIKQFNNLEIGFSHTCTHPSCPFSEKLYENTYDGFNRIIYLKYNF